MSDLGNFFRDYTAPGQNPTAYENCDDPAPDGSHSRFKSAYTHWKETRNSYIEEFMLHRLMDGDGLDGNDEEICEPKLVEASQQTNAEDEEEDQLETQDADLLIAPTQDVVRKKQIVPMPQPHFPNIADTTQDILYFRDLDLWTRTASFDLLHVTKVWRTRETRRFAVKYQPSSKSSTITFGSSATCSLPRIVLEACVEDGPLSTCYSRVWSAEVTQLNGPPLGGLRDRATHVFGESQVECRRMRIFCYNGWAQAMESIVARKTIATAKDDLWVQILNVPARCVFPLPPSDWYDAHDASPYCLCIGDASTMRIQPGEGEDDDSVVSARFDDDLLRMAVGWLDRNGQTQAFRVSVNAHGNIIEQRDDVTNELQHAYLRWQELLVVLEVPPVPADKREGAAIPTNKTHSQGPSDQDDSEVGTTINGSHPPQRSFLSTTGDANLSSSQGIRTTGKNPAVCQAAARREASATPKKHTTADAQPVPPLPRKKTKETIEYHQLNNLRNVYESHRTLAIQPGGSLGPCLVNVYGVVLGFGSPAQTKTGDWMVGIALVDETLPLAEPDPATKLVEFVHTVNLNIFAKHREDLPDLRCAGDVLRAHRVKLQEWNDEMQLLGLRASSYVTFRSNSVNIPGDESDYVIIPTAKNVFTNTAEDKCVFVKHWKWARNRLYSYATMKESQSFKLCDMGRQGYNQMDLYMDGNTRGDLTVIVTAVIPYPPEVASSSTPKGFLRVWDGTGLPESDPLPVSSQAAKDAVSNGDPPVEVVTKLAKLTEKLRHVRQNSDLETPKATAGRVANVVIWEKSHWKLVDNAVGVGSCIRLRNVLEERMPNDGLRCLMVQSKSYLTPLPDMTYEVIRLIEEHSDRLLRNEPLNSKSSILPLEPSKNDDDTEFRESTMEPHIEVAVNPMRSSRSPPPAALENNVTDLASLLKSPIATTVSCAVAIVGTFPSIETISTAGVQLVVSEGVDGRKLYRLGVRLGDQSTQLSAIISEKSEVGDALLGMSPQIVLLHHSHALRNLQSVLNDTSLWHAQLRTVAFEGAKYFLLEALSKL